MGSYSSNFLRLLSCTKLLTSYVNQGSYSQALSLFHEMHSSLALTLDPFVFPLALKSCAAINYSQLGSTIHAYTVKASLTTNPYIACALIDMYGKSVSISFARQLFDECPMRTVVVWNAMISLYAHSDNVYAAVGLFKKMDVVPNVSTYNSIISGLAELDGGSFNSIMFYRRMQSSGLKPNLITLLALLRSCVRIASLNLIMEIHAYSFKYNIEGNLQLRSCLVEAYGRCGCLDNARYVFERMRMRERDVVAWSSLISAYALHGEATNALEMFSQMEGANVKPDGITFLGVLKACSHSGLADEARVYFNKMQKDYKIEATSDHFSCLVDVLSRAGRLYEAYEVIQDMPVKPTAKTWGALLGACRIYGEVELAEIAGRALFEIEPNNAANYVLLGKIYATTGRHEEAHRIRREMEERGVMAAPGSSWVISQN